MAALPDRRWSEALEREIKSLVAARVAGQPAEAEQERFIAGLPKPILGELVKWEIVPAIKLHVARPIGEQVGEYIADLTARGRGKTYCENSRRFLERMVSECGWKTIADMTPDSFVAWRENLQTIVKTKTASINGETAQRAEMSKQASARTKNAYLKAGLSFSNWLLRQGRIAANSLVHVGSVEERGREVRIRRALTDAEVGQLLKAAKDYAVVYLTALTTGLRRGELAALKWGDVHLDAARPFISVRASISKNHKVATMFLRDDVAKALAARRTQDIGEDDQVFKLPGRKRFNRHLTLASIPSQDAQGRRVDFHALRHTFITALSRGGVTPRVTMELARHSRMELTMKTYTDAGLLATADAVDALPAWKPASDKPEAARALATGTDGKSEDSRAVTEQKRLCPDFDKKVRQVAFFGTSRRKSPSCDSKLKSQENTEFNGLSSTSFESGRQDLNLRPLDPQSSALNQAAPRPVDSQMILTDFEVKARLVNLDPECW